jgi:hypothetical protein
MKYFFTILFLLPMFLLSQNKLQYQRLDTKKWIELNENFSMRGFSYSVHRAMSNFQGTQTFFAKKRL